MIHDDTRYQKGTLNMRTQKCFAVKVYIINKGISVLPVANSHYLTSLRSMVSVELLGV